MLLSYQINVFLALWLMVAVPVACHHAAPRPLLLAASHDHSAHTHGVGERLSVHEGQLPAARTGLAVEPLRATGERCAACYLHDGSTVADALGALAAAVLAPALTVAAALTAQRLSAVPAASALSTVVARDDPPPRAALPSTGA